jgi:hypothetical protein
MFKPAMIATWEERFCIPRLADPFETLERRTLNQFNKNRIFNCKRTVDGVVELHILNLLKRIVF